MPPLRNVYGNTIFSFLTTGWYQRNLILPKEIGQQQKNCCTYTVILSAFPAVLITSAVSEISSCTGAAESKT